MASPRQPVSHLACDLGASSGRAILGRLGENGRLTIEEIHRFPNGAIPLAGTLRWDVVGLYREILAGLRVAAAREPALRSVSVDSWGVDYVLFSQRQPLLASPWCYRDARTDAPYAEFVADAAAGAEAWAETGIRAMAINTLYQLRAERLADPDLLRSADGFLPIADYLHYLLCGVARAEESVASTTQLFRSGGQGWSAALQRRFELPARLFPEVVPSATRLGFLRPELARRSGLPEGQLEVIAGCSHDTAAAVAAVPAPGDGGGWAYLVSGTWSLLGVERAEPLLTPEVRAADFTNERGLGGSVRLLKNIAGLWMLEESRREWAHRGQSFSYPALVKLARGTRPFRSLVRPEAIRFGRPGDMPGKIAAYCRETDQPAPETPGEFTRCIFESLALSYWQTVEELVSLTGQPLHTLHVVGGGSRNALLNQWTANATGRQVIAGPVEATAIGNLLLQALALGELGSRDRLRATVADSFPVRIFRPAQRKPWATAAGRFTRLDLLT